MVSTASTNALPMNCPWRNKLSPSPRPRRGVHIVKVCPVDNIYLLCYTATCLSSIAGAGYSSPFPSHQGVHTRWFGRALAWHARGHRFDPGNLHQKAPYLVQVRCFSFCRLWGGNDDHYGLWERLFAVWWVECWVQPVCRTMQASFPTNWLQCS